MYIDVQSEIEKNKCFNVNATLTIDWEKQFKDKCTYLTTYQGLNILYLLDTSAWQEDIMDTCKEIWNIFSMKKCRF